MLTNANVWHSSIICHAWVHYSPGHGHTKHTASNYGPEADPACVHLWEQRKVRSVGIIRCLGCWTSLGEQLDGKRARGVWATECPSQARINRQISCAPRTGLWWAVWFNSRVHKTDALYKVWLRSTAVFIREACTKELSLPGLNTMLFTLSIGSGLQAKEDNRSNP